MTFLYGLFRTHYRIVPESEMLQYVLENDIKSSLTPEDIEDHSELCCHCNGPVIVPTTREVKFLVGDGCIVTSTGTCPVCKEAMRRVTKFNHGLVFHQNTTGDGWESIFRYPPLWQQGLQHLKPPTIIIEP